MKTVLALVTALLVAFPSLGDQLLLNGDFEAGNTGFTTDYDHFPGILGNQKSYDILKNPSTAHISAASYGDHTTGSGFMMAGNESVTPNILFWSQTVSVLPNSDYAFSGWISSWTSNQPTSLDVRFNDVSIGIASAPAAAGVWQSFAVNWNSGSSATATIELRNLTIADVGGDFAIDDLALNGPPGASSVPEPTSILLALTGATSLLGWGYANRRRNAAY